MKRLAMVSGFLALATPLALAQTSTWKADPAHSEVDFSVVHLSVSNVHGRFGKIDATLSLNDADITKSSVMAYIEVSTVDTGESGRDADIKSSSFLNASEEPTAAFVSTSVAKSGDKLVVNGNFTLHGVTKPIVLMVEGPRGPAGMDHKPHVGYSASTTIKRSDFNIGSKYPNAIVGDEIKLNIELELVKQ